MEDVMRPRKAMKVSQLEIEKKMNSSKTKTEFQRLQCLHLRKLYPEMSAAEIGRIVCLSQSSVWRIHSEFFKNSDLDYVKEKRGGRYNENMTEEEENAFLDPFFKEAVGKGIIVVSKIKKAYENKIGHEVPKSTIYRLLERHGWRRIVPYKRHPKANMEEQESFKKKLL